METSTSKRPLVILVFFLLAAVLVATYFYHKKSGADSQSFHRIFYQEVNDSLKIRDLDGTLEKLKKAQVVASTEDEKTLTKLKIANVLIDRNSGGDREEAIRLFKKTVGDPAVSEKFRAIALAGIAFTYEVTGDANLLMHTVFNEEPYATYFRESKTGIYGALRRIYETSDALFPTALAKLEIAMNYAWPLYAGKTDGGLTKTQTAELIKKYVDDATPLMETLSPNRPLKANMHLIRAASLAAVDLTLKNVDRTTIEDAYREAISLSAEAVASDNATEIIQAGPILMASRLYYAMFLARTFGATRTNDIKTLVTPIIKKDAGHEAVVRKIKFLSRQNPSNERLRIIADLVPEFKAFLIESGWKG